MRGSNGGARQGEGEGLHPATSAGQTVQRVPVMFRFGFGAEAA